MSIPFRYPWAALVLAVLLAAPPLAAGGKSRHLGSRIKGALVLLLLASTGGTAYQPPAATAPAEPAGSVPLKVPEGLSGAWTELGPAPSAAEIQAAIKAFKDIMHSTPPGLPASLEEAVGADPGTPSGEEDAPAPGEDPRESAVTALKLAVSLPLGALFALETHGGRPRDLERALAKLKPLAKELAEHAKAAQIAYQRAGRQALAARRSGDREAELEALDRWTQSGSLAFTLRQTLRWHEDHPARILDCLQAPGATARRASAGSQQAR